jgi:hypothetical protein
MVIEGGEEKVIMGAGSEGIDRCGAGGGIGVRVQGESCN